MDNITIIGSGSFGCALAYILSKKNNNIKIWSYTKEETDMINNNHKCIFLDKFKLDDSIKCYMDYEKAINGSNYIILVTPSSAIRNTCKQIKPYIRGQEIIIASKGMENDKVLSEIVKEELNLIPSVISGPSHAEQIIKDVPTYIEYSGNKNINKLFETDTFKLKYNDDLIGVQVGGALKNVITLAVGIVEGLGYESNTISYVITEGLEEINNIAVKLGANKETIYGLSGLGDLLTTTTSLDSRNKRVGILLAQGKSLDEIKQETSMTIEGIETLNNACYLINKYNLDCKIIKNLYEIIYNNKEINSILD